MLDAVFENEGLIYTAGLDHAVKRWVPVGCRAGCGDDDMVGPIGPAALLPGRPAWPSLRQEYSACVPCTMANAQCPLPPPPILPAWCRYDFFGGQEAVLGQHDAAVKCVEWLPSRGLLVSGSWDRCATVGCQLWLSVVTVVVWTAGRPWQATAGSASATSHPLTLRCPCLLRPFPSPSPPSLAPPAARCGCGTLGQPPASARWRGCSCRARCTP